MSVRPSITRWYRNKMADVIRTELSQIVLREFCVITPYAVLLKLPSATNSTDTHTDIKVSIYKARMASHGKMIK